MLPPSPTAQTSLGPAPHTAWNQPGIGTMLHDAPFQWSPWPLSPTTQTSFALAPQMPSSHDGLPLGTGESVHFVPSQCMIWLWPAIAQASFALAAHRPVIV